MLSIKDIEIISGISLISSDSSIALNSGILSKEANEQIKVKQYKEICEEWAKLNNIKFINEINIESIDLEILREISLDIWEKLISIPLKLDNIPIIALSEPFNFEKIEMLQMLISKDIKIAYINPGLILSEISKIKSIEQKNRISSIINKDQSRLNNNENIFDLEKTSEEDSPAVCFVNNVIKEASEMGASDIHFESKDNGISSRIRKDGKMKNKYKTSNVFKGQVIARLKFMAGLDTSESRKPQDGRLKIKFAGKIVDLRINSMPSLHGERIVARFLGKNSYKEISSHSYFNNNIIKIFDKISKMQEGLVLITGPTGSGKTSTLYTILNKVNRISRNVITIEDPVEGEIDNVSQIQVQPKIGFNFQDALKHVLRQDPDVIMMGEIRDGITAKTSIQAAITGHLLLSTLHTPDAKTVPLRLIDMGIDTFAIASSLKYIFSQRLISKLCNKCKEKIKNEFIASKGCSFCDMGYDGRIAILEYIEVNDCIRDMINNKASSCAIWQQALDSNQAMSMEKYGKELVKNGLIDSITLNKCLEGVNE